MEKLVLNLLGSFQASLGERPLTQFRSVKVQALLIYLAVENAKVPGKIQQREALMELLWPGLPLKSAQVNLRQILYQLRKTIPAAQSSSESEPIPFLLSQHRTLQVNPDFVVELDVAAFSTLLIGQPKLDALETAVSLYRGDFLPDFFLPDSAPFEAWAASHRAAYRRQALDALEQLGAAYLQQTKYEKAQICARRQLEMDDLQETAVCQLLTALAMSGARSQALTEYEQFRQRLSQELGVDPSQETQNLFQQLLNDDLHLSPKALGLLGEDDVTAVSLPPFLQKSQGPEKGAKPLFVAREKQMAYLQTLLDDAIGERGQVAFIVGSAGQGKSTLLHAFAAEAQQKYPDLIVAYGLSNAFSGIGDPYLPFRQVLSMITGEVEAEWKAGRISNEQAGRLWHIFPRTLQTLLDKGPDLIDTFVDGKQLVQRASAAAPGGSHWLKRLQKIVESRAATATKPDIEQANLFTQYTYVLKELSQHAPLLILLDDLQWADEASTNLLFHLGRAVSDGRMMVIGAYRPEEIALGRENERHPLQRVINECQRQYGNELLDLGQQNEPGSRAFVDEYLDSEPNQLDEPFRQKLAKYTGGHALFVVELVRMLQEREHLFQDEEGVWLADDLTWDTLPTRVEAVIAERIGRLDDENRQILSVASVEGETFTPKMIAQILQVPEQNLLRRLAQELDKRHRLVREYGEVQAGRQLLSQYRFAHNLFQQYLYHELSLGERRVLHGEIALIIQGLFPDNFVQLAYHYNQAGIVDKALQYLIEAGHQARALYANEEAARLYSQALPLTDTESSERFELLLARTAVYKSLAWRDEQWADIESLLSLAESLDDDTHRCDALIVQAEYFLATKPRLAQKPTAKAAALAQAMKDISRQGHALRCHGESHRLAYEYAQSCEKLEAAASCFRQAGLKAELAACLHALAYSLHYLDNYSAALTEAKEALNLARESKDKRLEAICLQRLAWFYSYGGREPDKALPFAEQALVLHRDVGDKLQETRTLNILGIIHAFLENIEEGVTCWRDALEIAYSIGSAFDIRYPIGNLNGYYYRQKGLYEAAIEFLKAQLKKAGPGDEEWTQWVQGGLIHTSILFGRYEQALERTQSLLPEIIKYGSHQQHAQFLLYLGWAQAEKHLFHEAQQSLREADELITEKALPLDVSAQLLAAWARTFLIQGDPARVSEGLAKIEEAVRLLKESNNPNKIILTKVLNIAAQYHLKLNQVDEALAASSELIQILEGSGLLYTEPHYYFLTHSRVLRALNHEEEADDYLRRAYNRVMQVAENTKDPVLRQNWLENMPINQEIQTAWAKHNPAT